MLGSKKSLGYAMIGSKMPLGKNMFGSKMPLLDLMDRKKVRQDVVHNIKSGLERRVLKR